MNLSEYNEPREKTSYFKHPLKRGWVMTGCSQEKHQGSSHHPKRCRCKHRRTRENTKLKALTSTKLEKNRMEGKLKIKKITDVAEAFPPKKRTK
jgi:hypothetical protein